MFTYSIVFGTDQPRKSRGFRTRRTAERACVADLKTAQIESVGMVWLGEDLLTRYTNLPTKIRREVAG